jgi:tetratricopeptide (TPR) repeat protein
MHRALELNPLSLVYASNLGRFLHQARRYPEAIDALKRVLAVDPGRVYARIHLADSYEAAGMYGESGEQFRLIQTALGGHPRPGVAHFYAATGDPARAKKIAGQLRRDARDSDWFFLAGVYARLGEIDQAFSCLELAYEKRDFFLVFLEVDPYMDPLRSDPRYVALVQRIGLRSRRSSTPSTTRHP